MRAKQRAEILANGCNIVNGKDKPRSNALGPGCQEPLGEAGNEGVEVGLEVLLVDGLLVDEGLFGLDLSFASIVERSGEDEAPDELGSEPLVEPVDEHGAGHEGHVVVGEQSPLGLWLDSQDELDALDGFRTTVHDDRLDAAAALEEISTDDAHVAPGYERVIIHDQKVRFSHL